MGKIRNLEEKKLLFKRFLDPFRGQGRTSAGGRGYPREFSIYSVVNCGAAKALGSIIENVSLFFWFSRFFVVVETLRGLKVDWKKLRLDLSQTGPVNYLMGGFRCTLHDWFKSYSV